MYSLGMLHGDGQSNSSKLLIFNHLRDALRHLMGHPVPLGWAWDTLSHFGKVTSVSVGRNHGHMMG